MIDLIKRLEAAEAGSRELDARIKIAISDPDVMTDGGGYKPSERRPPKYEKASEVFNDQWLDWEGAAMTVRAPHYTTSIDAALTLVPEGWFLKSLGYGVKATWFAIVSPGDSAKNVRGDKFNNPALALTIAALKAREAVDG